MPQPTDFPGATITIAKDQPPYLPLPARHYGDDMGTLLTCWQLTEEELAEVLKTGKLWVTMLTFNQPIQPIAISVERPVDDYLMQNPQSPNTVGDYTGTWKCVRTSNLNDETMSDHVEADGLTQEEAEKMADDKNAKFCHDRSSYYWTFRKSTEVDYEYRP